jgi:hypothetical protein
VQLYTHHPPARKLATNTVFHMPPNVNQGLQVLQMCTTEAWHIKTSWSMDDFLHFLMVVRPSLESLWALLNFADVFIQTRQAGGPVSGHSPVARLASNQMFLASFLTVETHPLAFSEGPPLPEMVESINYGEEDEDNGDKSWMDVDDAGPSSKN